MINVRLSYTFELERGSLELFAQGNNLADQNARVHTSFLRDFAPLPGRNLVFGLRGRF
jgi:iron complex outermembrane receptor protein